MLAGSSPRKLLSPSHRFGQIIGDILEAMLRPSLQAAADKHGLYLDYKHRRPARGGNLKVTWRDHKGNTHDLDYVLEAGGSETVVGRPKAFIESAWRRYTKHSRNKAQEIQGAVVMLSETYRADHPFLGVALAGVFTAGSLTQLASHGFHVLFYPYESVVRAFAAVGIDADYGETTPEADMQSKVDAYEALPDARKAVIGRTLLRLHSAELHTFIQSLEVVLTRTVQAVYVVALHGSSQEMTSVADAITFLIGYTEAATAHGFLRYEVLVRYTNGNEMSGRFNDKGSAIDYLRQYA